ncbi:MAG: hypothetical protein OJF50_004453 [Nitrospira sp.]|nr:hypothetical protein [Nitrospira sp.]
MGDLFSTTTSQTQHQWQPIPSHITLPLRFEFFTREEDLYLFISIWLVTLWLHVFMEQPINKILLKIFPRFGDRPTEEVIEVSQIHVDRRQRDTVNVLPLNCLKTSATVFPGTASSCW